MKKIVMALALGTLGALGAFGIGCGADKCATAADDIQQHYDDCGGPAISTTTSGTAAECTEAAGTLAECQAACYVAASCDCLGLGDATKCTADDAKKFGDCTTACSK